MNDPSRAKDLPAASGCDFYDEQKWCDHCRQYVRFLMSINHSYCVHCGSRVRLFNRDDADSFREHVQRHRWQAS